MPEYDFFLSYARDDRRNDGQETIDRFHRELVDEIRVRRPADRIGFFDTGDIKQGESWPEELVEALGSCRAFVPIFSPAYFTREYCGKEWAVFQSRLEAHVRRNGGPTPPLIHPVLLLRRDVIKPVPASIADAFERLQTDNDVYPEIYRREGLRYMARLAQHRDDFTRLVVRFAERLVETIEQHALDAPAALPDLREIASAFGNGVAVSRPGASTATVGRFAQFVFVAGRPGELNALRQDVSRYGDAGGMDWQPFHPDVQEEVAIIAQEVASTERLRYEAIPADGSLAERLREAEDERKIVAVIADAWTLRLEGYRRLLTELDARNLPNCVVIVPWNLDDPETAANEEGLQAALQLTFARRTAMAQTDWLYDNIHSLADLKNELSRALTGAQMRLIRVEEVKRRAEGAGNGSAPVVVGPGAAG